MEVRGVTLRSDLSNARMELPFIIQRRLQRKCLGIVKVGHEFPLGM
jgi:hypothetical protein